MFSRGWFSFVAVASLACAAGGQGVALHFEPERASVGAGETVTWTLSASFTGFTDPTAYFAEFLGDIVPADASLATISSYEPLTGMRYGGNTPPGFIPGGLRDLHLQSSVIFGNDDPSNPREIFRFTTRANNGPGEIRFDAPGTASVVPDGSLFTPPVRFDDVPVTSGSVTIVTAPDPELSVRVIPDRARAFHFDRVSWRVEFAFPGFTEPDALLDYFRGSLGTTAARAGTISSLSAFEGFAFSVQETALMEISDVLVLRQPPVQNGTPVSAFRFETLVGTPAAVEYTVDGAVFLKESAMAPQLRFDDFLVESGGVEFVSTYQGPTEIAVSVPPDAPDGARFGELVAVDDQSGVAIVTAPGESIAGEPGWSGAVYLVHAGSGTVLHRLEAGSPLANGAFGRGAAIGGGLVAVGASENAGTSFSEVGSVYVFDIATGEQTARIVRAAAGEPDPLFGRTVAVDAGRVLSRDDDDVFVYDGRTGEQIRRIDLDARDVAAGGRLAASGGRVLVAGEAASWTGAWMHHGAVYDIQSGELVANLIGDRRILDAPDGGVAVGLAGGVAVIGVPYDQREFSGVDTALAPGAVYIFDAQSGEQLDRIRVASGTGTVGFGARVATDGVRVIAASAGDAPMGGPGAPIFEIATGRYMGEVPPVPLGGGIALAGDRVLVGAPEAIVEEAPIGRVGVFDIAVPCARADLAAPWSVLDLSDIVAFVSAFEVQGIASDLAPPWGVCDLSDIGAFIGGFMDGCP